MVNDCLFELGCEELPSGSVLSLAESLAASVAAALNKAQIPYQHIKAFATPRRLAFLITALADEQPVQRNIRRGPALNAAYDAEGKPAPALLGFAKSCGVSVGDLNTEKTAKGEWVIHESIVEGAKTAILLPELIRQALTALPIAKPMRWGSGLHEFARPVHWLILLSGNEVLPCEIFGLTAGRNTYGHRFHHPQAVAIQQPDDYEQNLFKAFVIADFARRRAMIEQQIAAAASQHGAIAVTEASLLDEVTSIVEWPQTLIAGFSEEFLEVPAEALIAAMQVHQKCFPLRDQSGNLTARFATVTNIESQSPAQVIAGNEKVMRARLSDAAFFFQQDKKQPLAHHLAATGRVVFQIKLGTLLEKSTRMQEIMALLAEPLALNKKQAVRAAELSKCDLMTGMVGEFPELQGLMGACYARHDGEDEEVAVALQEQYLPRFSADTLPQTALGLALSLADRLDILVGIFAIGQKPSGVKDPFKLRRHALAVIRMLINTPIALNLQQLLTETARIYRQQFENNPIMLAELQVFILDRLQSYYQAQGINADIVLAVQARHSGSLYDFDRRVQAVAGFVQRPEALALSAASKRVKNLSVHVDQQNQSTAIDEKLLNEPAEQALYSALLDKEKKLEPLYAKGDYDSILNAVANLREVTDTFFEQVMVMVDDKALKENRLALLFRLQSMLQEVADISLLQSLS